VWHKFVKWAAAGLAFYYVVTRPAEAAETARSVAGGAAYAAEQLGAFLGSAL